MGLLLDHPFNERKKKRDLCYLGDEHPRGHGETGSRGEVTRDHDPHSGLREGQLVGIGTKQLIHHQHRWFPVVVSCWTHKSDHVNIFFSLYAQEVFFCLAKFKKRKTNRLKSHLSSAAQL